MNSALKWFALVLVFFNVAYLIWALASPSSQTVKSTPRQLAGEKIILLDELPETERQAMATMVSEPYCPSLGPFETAGKLQEFGQKLAKNGLSSTARTVTLDSSEKFRVYLPSYVSYEAANDALKKLRANKIDSYIMTEAPFANSISLGIFSSEDSAEGLVKKMSSHGFRALVAPAVMEKQVYWLDLSRPQNSEKAEQILISLLSGAKGIARIDSPCKVVALAQ